MVILVSQFATDNHPERVSQYKKHEHKFNFTGINYPVQIKDIKKFEAQNPKLSINVFGCYLDEVFGKEYFEIYPIHISQKYDGIEHKAMVDLLLIEGRHYVWIKNFSGFCFRLTEHNSNLVEDVIPYRKRDTFLTRFPSLKTVSKFSTG